MMYVRGFINLHYNILLIFRNVIAAVICAALILGSFAVGASTVLHMYEENVQRAEKIIHESQSGNVKEELRQFRSSVGSGNAESALDEAARRIGHGIK